MTSSIVHALTTSIKAHIRALWLGDKYATDGSQTQVAFCPTELEELLTYTDKNGTERIFGPTLVALGRVQEDTLNLAKNSAVPSVYIEVAGNDFENVEDWRHSIYTSLDSAQKADDPGFLFEVGSSHMMHRRIVVKMTTFFLESNQLGDEVERLGSAALSFLESMLTSYTTMPQDWAWKMLDSDGVAIVDSFGERPYRCYPVITHCRRRGGPTDDYIWDTKLYLEVATFKEV